MKGKIDGCMSLLNPYARERDPHQYEQYQRDKPCIRLPWEPTVRTEREASLHKTMRCVRIYQGRMDGSGTVDMTGHTRFGFRRRARARSDTVGKVMHRDRQGPLPSKRLSRKNSPVIIGPASGPFDMGHTSRQQPRFLYHPIPAGARIRQRPLLLAGPFVSCCATMPETCARPTTARRLPWLDMDAWISLA